MKTINLSEVQFKLLLEYLSGYGNYISGEVCDDLSKEHKAMFTPEEGKQIAEEFAVYNNPKVPDGPDWPISEGCLIYWLQRKIQDQVKQ